MENFENQKIFKNYNIELYQQKLVNYNERKSLHSFVITNNTCKIYSKV